MELNGTTGPTLVDLIDICRASEDRFRQSAGRTHRAELKQLFAWRADEFAQLADELSRRSTDGPGDGRLETSLPSVDAHDGHDDASLLNACERSEEDVLARFDRALSCELVPELRAMLADERERLQRHRVQLHSLRSRLTSQA